jgi:hypothetical protein
MMLMYFRFILLGMLLSTQTVAQYNPKLQVDAESMKKLRKSQAPLVQQKNKQFPQNIKDYKPFAETLTAVDSNRYGFIYVLPQDNMPVLYPYPTGNNRMPGTAENAIIPAPIAGEGVIPNAIPPKRYQFVLPTKPAQ